MGKEKRETSFLIVVLMSCAASCLESTAAEEAPRPNVSLISWTTEVFCISALKDARCNVLPRGSTLIPPSPRVPRGGKRPPLLVGWYLMLEHPWGAGWVWKAAPYRCLGTLTRDLTQFQARRFSFNCGLLRTAFILRNWPLITVQVPQPLFPTKRVLCLLPFGSVRFNFMLAALAV